MPVTESSHTQRFFNCTHWKVTGSHSHRRCLSGEVSGNVWSFFLKPPQSYRSVVLWLISPPLPLERAPFLFALCILRFLLEEKIGRSDQTVLGCPLLICLILSQLVKLTIFHKRIRCIDMSNSLPVVKLSARPRNSPEPLNQMWCVESILLVGYFIFSVFVELNSPSHSVVMNKTSLILLSYDNPGWWWPSSRSSSC